MSDADLEEVLSLPHLQPHSPANRAPQIRKARLAQLKQQKASPGGQSGSGPSPDDQKCAVPPSPSVL
jgi:hypothetical protein